MQSVILHFVSITGKLLNTYQTGQQFRMFKYLSAALSVMFSCSMLAMVTCGQTLCELNPNFKCCWYEYYCSDDINETCSDFQYMYGLGYKSIFQSQCTMADTIYMFGGYGGAQSWMIIGMNIDCWGYAACANVEKLEAKLLEKDA